MSKYELSNLALKSAFSDNTIITDDKGLPSVMVFVPKFKISDVIAGGSDSVHPAFIVDGVEKDGIYISKYQNVVYDGRAYSLPGEDPSTLISIDKAIDLCAAKGAGWHLMTAMEWGAIALWCKKNGWLPYGNNHYGRDASESVYKAIPATVDSEGRTNRSATGTGPVEWSHNKQLDGIYDLNGNIWEWNGGARLHYGELQILENNNAANSVNSQDESSAQWKAIDGTTGDLITPDGNGTTPNSIKLDMVVGHWEWITGNSFNSQDGTSRRYNFKSITAASAICDKAKELLYALALLPDDSTFDYKRASMYCNNNEPNRMISRGGFWESADVASVFYTGLSFDKTFLATSTGFRAAYYE